MDHYAGSPGHSTNCYAELAASFVNFLHYCSPSSGFYGAGNDNRGRCTNKPSGCPTFVILPFFMLNASSTATLPIYLGLGFGAGSE